jgi:Derlin-2/3
MNQQQQAVPGDVLAWFYEIPPVSRILLSAAFATTTACYLDLVSPLALYYNYDLILSKGQLWRLVSSFLYFGSFSIDFLFHLYFIIRYSKLLEEGTFRNRTADYIFMLLFCASIILLFAVSFDIFAKIKFLG